MSKKIVAQNEAVVIGADVHMNKHVVTVKAKSEIIGTMHLPPNPEAWRTLLKRFPACEVDVVYESGPQGYNLSDWLTEMEWENETRVSVHIAPPALIPKAPGKIIKTDKRDSIALIQAFEMKSFRPVVVPSKRAREERELVRTREQMKEMQRQVKNQIHGMVKFHGVKYPESGKWSGAWLSGLEMSVKAADTTGYLLISFKAKLDLYNMTVGSIKALDKKILEIAKEGNCQDIARKLERIPGVGWHSATVIATEVADFKAFDNSGCFASYVGLVPREHSSGDSIKRGHITKAGNHRLRRTFVECAWIWIRYDEEARRQYNKIKMGKPERTKIAITAMARKLAVKAYHIATSEPRPEEQEERKKAA